MQPFSERAITDFETISAPQLSFPRLALLRANLCKQHEIAKMSDAPEERDKLPDTAH